MLPKNDSEKMKNVISNTTEFLLNQIKQSKRVIFQSVSNGVTGTSKILYNGMNDVVAFSTRVSAWLKEDCVKCLTSLISLTGFDRHMFRLNWGSRFLHKSISSARGNPKQLSSRSSISSNTSVWPLQTPSLTGAWFVKASRSSVFSFCYNLTMFPCIRQTNCGLCKQMFLSP